MHADDGNDSAVTCTHSTFIVYTGTSIHTHNIQAQYLTGFTVVS